MVRSEDRDVLGWKSTARTAGFGLACALSGAIVATLCWTSLGMDNAVSPRLAPMNSETAVSHRIRMAQSHERSVASHTENTKQADDPSKMPLSSDPPSSDVEQPHHHNQELHVRHHVAGHSDCAFCRDRAKRFEEQANACDAGEAPEIVEALASQSAAPSPTTDAVAEESDDAFVPLHLRSEYRVESPDVLHFEFERGENPEEAIVSGLYIVQPNGRVQLGAWGELPVAGRTVREIQWMLETAMASDKSPPQVQVSVAQANSRVVYIVKQDAVHRHYYRGDETALDLLVKSIAVKSLAKQNVWISRPHANGNSELLRVSLTYDVDGTLTAKNPRLLPGDRILIDPESSSLTTHDLDCMDLNRIDPNEKSRQAQRPAALNEPSAKPQ